MCGDDVHSGALLWDSAFSLLLEGRPGDHQAAGSGVFTAPPHTCLCSLQRGACVTRPCGTDEILRADVAL